MPNKKSAQEAFLEDLNPSEDIDILNRPIDLGTEATPVAEEPEATPVVEDVKSNRRERRLEAKLQAEREAGIAMAARLEALSEAAKLRSESEAASFEKLAERIYGNQTPENAEATQLLINALKEVEKSSTEKALELIREEQRKEREAAQKAEKELDNMIEEIEDEYNVTLDEATQKAFFNLLNKLSPKDSDGEIIAFADHHAVWDELKARKQTSPQTNRAKDLASRSMVKTGAPADGTLEDDALRKFLQSQGWDV